MTGATERVLHLDSCIGPGAGDDFCALIAVQKLAGKNERATKMRAIAPAELLH